LNKELSLYAIESEDRPEVRHNGRVGPRVLAIETDSGVARDDQIEGLVEPAVVSVAVKQELSVTVEFRRVFRLKALGVEHENEGRLFDGRQRDSVNAFGEPLVARVGPRAAVGGRERGETRLSVVGGRVVGDDLVEQLLELFGLQETPLVVNREFVELAGVQHHDVWRVRQVREPVCVCAGNASRVEDALVLRGTQRHEILDENLRARRQ
jgi:hypothetical protein